MFSQMFVCPPGGWVGIPSCITGHMNSIQGGLPTGGLHLGGEGCAVPPPHELEKAGRGGGWGTHPTGMLSCLLIIYFYCRAIINFKSIL